MNKLFAALIAGLFAVSLNVSAADSITAGVPAVKSAKHASHAKHAKHVKHEKKAG